VSALLLFYPVYTTLLNWADLFGVFTLNFAEKIVIRWEFLSVLKISVSISTFHKYNMLLYMFVNMSPHFILTIVVIIVVVVVY
jgi:hypothetical protein